MTQNQLIELISRHFSGIRKSEIRLHLNDALREFCRDSRVLTGGFEFTTTADQRYYDLDDKLIEATSVDFDGYDIPRLTGRPEKRDLT